MHVLEPVVNTHPIFVGIERLLQVVQPELKLVFLDVDRLGRVQQLLIDHVDVAVAEKPVGMGIQNRLPELGSRVKKLMIRSFDIVLQLLNGLRYQSAQAVPVSENRRRIVM